MSVMAVYESATPKPALKAHLLPCPHCGASTARQDSSSGADEVECGTCQAYTWGETQEAAIAAWNRRPQPVDVLDVLPDPFPRCSGCRGRGEVDVNGCPCADCSPIIVPCPRCGGSRVEPTESERRDD